MLFLDQRGTARDEARTAEAQRLGAQALVEDDLDRSLLLARQGVALDDSLQTRGNLLAALHAQPGRDRRRARRRHAGSAGWRCSPDGRALVVGDEHGDVVVPRSGHAPAAASAVRARTPLYIRALAFSPRRLAAARSAASARSTCSTATPFRRIAALDLPGHDDRSSSTLAFSPDGRELVASTTADRRRAGERTRPDVLLRFDGRTGQRIGSASIAGQGSLADVAAFTPDGRRLITADARDGVRCPARHAGRVSTGAAIVRARRAHAAAAAPLPGDAVAGALSPDGAHVRRRRRRTARSGSSTCAPGGSAPPQGATTRRSADAAFTPDGRFLVTVGDDANGHRLGRPRRDGGSRRFAGHAGASLGAGRRPRRPPALHGGADGTRDHLGPRGDRRLGRPFDAGRTSGDWFLETTISRDGRTLATQQADGTVSLVDLATLRSPHRPIAARRATRRARPTRRRSAPAARSSSAASTACSRSPTPTPGAS